jgi:exodeoxyribonuclease VII large subunit
MNDEFLTVSELNNFIQGVIKSGFPRAVWVTGEIQELKDKKHLYFTLSEKDERSSEIVAKISATIWANTRPRIEAILQKAENAFELKDDIEVKLLCKVDYYPPFGKVSLIVESIDPVYTLGKIAQDRQRLISQLKAKGIFDRNKRLPLARVPLHIGLITSYDSAAYHDFTDEIRRSGFGFKIFIVNAAMQGKNTEMTVVKALKVLNRMDGLDVVVITRGGGSITELSCFDSQLIAEAIAESQLPVFSGIGHEINTTITDLAAHTFAKTPTAVAQMLAGRVQEFLMHINEREEELIRLAYEYIGSQQTHLKDNAHMLQKGTIALVRSHQHRISTVREAINRAPVAKLKESKRCLVQCRDDLKKTIHLHLQNTKAKISSFQKLVEMADPKNTLKRGFTITRNADGKIIRSIKDVKQSETITTMVADGKILSDVR